MKRTATAILAFMAAVITTAQGLTYNRYMQRVLENNTAIVARSLDIEIAEANVRSSKIYENPTLAVEYGNNEDWDKKLGYSISASLSRKFTFGVRRTGIRLAEKELEATIAVFNDYMRNFHADATIAYLNHLRAKALLKTAQKREEYMKRLALGDSLRFVRGETAKAAWIETRLAAGLARNARLQAQAECKNTFIELGYFMGKAMQNDDTAAVEESLEQESTPTQPLSFYIDAAIDNRADIDEAFGRLEIAKAQSKLNRARRRIDIELSLGMEYNKGAHRDTPSEPSFTKIMAGASIPLKFSNLNKGARIMEQTRIRQAEQELVDTRLRIQTEVMQAYSTMQIAEEQARTFTESILKETAELLESKRKAYRLGEISFMEFIETERSDNMMQEEYINALFNRAVSHVELLRSIGTGYTKTTNTP